MAKSICTIGIIAGGPNESIPDLEKYKYVIDYWIGADYGCVTLLKYDLPIDLAVGDFDSIDQQAFENVAKQAKQIVSYPIEKDETDLELAVKYAVERSPEQLYFFGVTGGRMDHTLANVQQLLPFLQKQIKAIIVDNQNAIQLYEPGIYEVEQSETYTDISFLSFSETVEGLSLSGFYYPLNKYTLSWGSTRCLSNKLLSKKGTFSFDRGILIMIKSCDVLLK